MSGPARKRARLARLEQIAELKATVERARLARATRDEVRIAREVTALADRRTAATERISQDATPDMTLIAATGAWLRASEADIRRLNIQLAALRARSETVRITAARAIARHRVCETLLERSVKAAKRKRS